MFLRLNKPSPRIASSSFIQMGSKPGSFPEYNDVLRIFMLRRETLPREWMRGRHCSLDSDLPRLPLKLWKVLCVQTFFFFKEVYFFRHSKYRS